jgi:hypothetical protein
MALVGLGVHQRHTVVSIVPQTGALFAAVGLPVNLRGVEFVNVRAELSTEKDQSVLIVEGDIRGIAPGRSQLAPLTVSLRDENGHMIFEWVSEAPALAVGLGETVPFRTRLVSPPYEGQKVVVRFAERDSRVARR